MDQSTGDRGGHDLGQLVDGPMLRACFRPAIIGYRTGPGPASGSPLVCSFLRAPKAT